MSVKTIQAEPTSATYLDTYAWILFLEGRYEEAKMYIDQAISNDSTDESSADVYEQPPRRSITFCPSSGGS